MKKLTLILSPLLLITLLFPSLAFGVTVDDLVVREGLAYRKGTDVPFTGKTTGKKQWSFKDGKRDGPSIEYYDNGQLQLKANYKDWKQIGPYIEYHKNGQLWNKGTFKNDEMEGPWVSYLENGQLRSKGTYKNGYKDGPWVSYKKDGTVWEEYTGTYKNGLKVK